MKPYVLITGASHGIGTGIATALATRKYNLILTCHTATDALKVLAEELSAKYEIRVIAKQCDVSSSDEIATLFKQIPAPEIVINNAGISHVGLLQDMTDEEWNRILSVNLSGAFYISRSVIPSMLKEQRGHIINISSVWGNAGASLEVAYSATKGGINAFTKALAKELAPSGIRVNAIACGAIDTRMNAQLSNEEKDALCEEIPAGRFGTPEEVGEAVAALLEMPDYLTGQIISLDGGWI